MKNFIFCILFMAFGSLSAVAQSTVAATGTVAAATTASDSASLDQLVDATISLVKDGHSMGRLALSVAILNLLVMALKTDLLGNWFSKKSPGMKRLLLVAFGQAIGILAAMEGGLTPMAAILGGLVTSGGAVAVWEALQPLLPAKKPTT